MMDGQHVCQAVVDYGQSVACQLEKWKCPSADYMARLFRQFNILQRSHVDCAKAKHIAMGFPWPQWITEKTLAALALEHKMNLGIESSILNQDAFIGGRGGTTTHLPKNRLMPVFTLDEKIDLINEHEREAAFLADLLRNTDGTYKNKKTIKHINKAIIIMMMFRTLRVSENVAGRFWTSLIDGERLTAEDPIYHLREWLFKVRMGVTAESRSIVKNREFIARITRAWNTVRQGGNPKSIYTKENLIPNLI